jgi:hypothetical protein
MKRCSLPRNKVLSVDTNPSHNQCSRVEEENINKILEDRMNLDRWTSETMDDAPGDTLDWHSPPRDVDLVQTTGLFNGPKIETTQSPASRLQPISLPSSKP